MGAPVVVVVVVVGEEENGGGRIGRRALVCPCKRSAGPQQGGERGGGVPTVNHDKGLCHCLSR